MWKELKLPSGASYQYKWDDHCIALRVGENVIYLEGLDLIELVKIAWKERTHELSAKLPVNMP